MKVFVDAKSEFEKSDKFYICLPLFHANGLFMQLLACLINKNKAIIREKFSATNWLNDIIKFKTLILYYFSTIRAIMPVYFY